MSSVDSLVGFLFVQKKICNVRARTKSLLKVSARRRDEDDGVAPVEKEEEEEAMAVKSKGVPAVSTFPPRRWCASMAEEDWTAASHAPRAVPAAAATARRADISTDPHQFRTSDDVCCLHRRELQTCGTEDALRCVPHKPEKMTLRVERAD